MFVVENDEHQQSKVRQKNNDDAEIQTIQKLIEKITKTQM